MSVNPKGIIEKVVLSLFFLLAGFNPGNTRTVLSISCFLLSLSGHKDPSHCLTLIVKEENLGPFGAHQVQCRFRFYYQEGRTGPFQVNHHFKDAWALLELTKFHLINSEQLRACQLLLIYLGSFGARHV